MALPNFSAFMRAIRFLTPPRASGIRLANVGVPEEGFQAGLEFFFMGMVFTSAGAQIASSSRGDHALTDRILRNGQRPAEDELFREGFYFCPGDQRCQRKHYAQRREPSGPRSEEAGLRSPRAGKLVMIAPNGWPEYVSARPISTVKFDGYSA